MPTTAELVAAAQAVVPSISIADVQAKLQAGSTFKPLVYTGRVKRLIGGDKSTTLILH